MPIRHATYSDIPRIATTLAASFDGEELNELMFPFRKEFPEDYVRSWRRMVWEHWWDLSRVWLVAVELRDELAGEIEEERNEGGGTEVVVGVAEWQRMGEGWEGVWGVNGWWDLRLLLPSLAKLATRLLNLLTHDRSSARPTPSDPTPITMNNFEDAIYPFIEHHFSEPLHRRNHWSLCTLGVDQRYQHRGIGRELVTWGLERARVDGVPAAVIGAKGKERFYGRCGFDLIVGWATEGVDEKGNRNPLGERGVGGGCIMFTRVKEDGEGEISNSKKSLDLEAP